jgi:hypothetical protein
MRHTVLLLSLILVPPFHALVLPQKHLETLHAPSTINSGIPSKTAGSLATTSLTIAPAISTDTATYLYLPITSEAPDILGIGEISGFYGPGAWAGWFILIVSSWCRVLRASVERFDPNTLIFLFTTNWAAIDLLRTTRSMGEISKALPSDKDQTNKLKGTLGAAFNVTFWGTTHALSQLFFTMIYFPDLRILRHRVRTFFLGSIVPSLALMCSIRLASNSFVPALYWHGIEDFQHVLNVVFASLIGVCSIPLFVAIVSSEGILVLPKVVSQRLKRIVLESGIPWAKLRQIVILLCGGIFLLGMVSVFLGLIILAITKNDSLVSAGSTAMSFLLLVPSVLVIPLWWILCVGVCVTYYAVRAYMTRGVKASESCFFMPCAPQSIKEEDQLFALIAGLLLFVGWEILPVVRYESKKRYRDRKAFVQDVELRMRQLQTRRLLTRINSGNETVRRTQSERED